MKNTTKGFLAGAAGLGLILGGSTFALWTDTEGVGSNTTLTAGNLAVGVVNSEWRDISSDRWDRGHKINDIEKFRIIPGDKIQAKYGVSVGLEGDNMVAKLSLKDKQGKPVGDLARGLKVTYKLEKAGGGLWPFGEEELEGDSAGVEMNLISREAETLFAEDNDQRIPWWHMVVDRDIDNKPDFYVTVTVEFKDVDEREFAQTSAKLGEAQLELEQVRDGVWGY